MIWSNQKKIENVQSYIFIELLILLHWPQVKTNKNHYLINIINLSSISLMRCINIFFEKKELCIFFPLTLDYITFYYKIKEDG